MTDEENELVVLDYDESGNEVVGWVPKPGLILGPRVPGYNVDRLDIAAGIRELKLIGYTEPHTEMVITYALQRWARGEEADAERGAIDLSFYGIDLTSWRRVLAAAMAAADASQVQDRTPE